MMKSISRRVIGVVDIKGEFEVVVLRMNSKEREGGLKRMLIEGDSNEHWSKEEFTSDIMELIRFEISLSIFDSCCIVFYNKLIVIKYSILK